MTTGAGLQLFNDLISYKIIKIFDAEIKKHGEFVKIPKAKLSLLMGKALQWLLKEGITRNICFT